MPKHTDSIARNAHQGVSTGTGAFWTWYRGLASITRPVVSAETADCCAVRTEKHQIFYVSISVQPRTIKTINKSASEVATVLTKISIFCNDTFLKTYRDIRYV